MSPAILFYTVAFSFFLFAGISVFITNPGRRIHIIFFLLSLVLAGSVLGGILMLLTETSDAAQRLFTFHASLLLLLPSLFMLFAIEFSEQRFSEQRRKTRWYIILTGVTVFLIYTFIRLPLPVALVRVDGIWCMSGLIYPGPVLLYIVYFALASLAYVALLLRRIRTAARSREKREAIILVFSYLFGIVPIPGILLLGYFDSMLHLMAGLGPFFSIPWYLGVFYCIARYRFFSLTPEIVCRQLIENIDESLVLLDERKRIVFSNEAAGRTGRGETTGLGELILEHRSLEREIDLLLTGRTGSFDCRCSYRAGVDEYMPVQAKFSLVRDRYGDVLGVMIAAKRVKELGLLKSIYRITDREGDILLQLIAGGAYQEAAESLGISIYTFKRHISNIYHKIGVENRAELMNLLRDYELIPEQRSVS